MLKLIYTEDGLHLEWVSASLEALVGQRVALALRLGETLHVEPGRASFLLPLDAPGLGHLEATLRESPCGAIAFTPVDDEYVEISLQGSWIAETADAMEGMFLASFSVKAEYLAYQLWQATQASVSSLI